METDIVAMQSDLDEAINGMTAHKERADRLQTECNRTAEELRQEQDNYNNAETLRKQLEIEIREITIRLEEAESFALIEEKRQLTILQAKEEVANFTMIQYRNATTIKEAEIRAENASENPLSGPDGEWFE